MRIVVWAGLALVAAALFGCSRSVSGSILGELFFFSSAGMTAGIVLWAITLSLLDYGEDSEDSDGETNTEEGMQSCTKAIVLIFAYLAIVFVGLVAVGLLYGWLLALVYLVILALTIWLCAWLLRDDYNPESDRDRLVLKERVGYALIGSGFALSLAYLVAIFSEQIPSATQQVTISQFVVVMLAYLAIFGSGGLLLNSVKKQDPDAKIRRSTPGQ